MNTLYKTICYAFFCSALASVLTGCGGGTSVASDDDAADPVVVEIPIAYVRRPAPAPDANGIVRYTNLNDPIEMFPGARLYVRPRSSNLANEIDLTDRIANKIATELGVSASILAIDIKGLEASYDGSKLIFSVRAIPDIDNNDEPELYTWNLWIYNFNTDSLNYVIPTSLVRDEGASTGGGQDMDPHFLTDDRIVFSSSRQVAIQAK